MELQIQDLVSSIRKEGIEVANAEAENIIAEAKKRAESLVASAKSEAQQYKDSAEKEISILRESAAVSAEQAKRDAVLAFKTEIQEEFEKILAADIRKEMTGNALGKLIRAAIAGENVADYAAEVSEVSEVLKSELAEEIKKGLEIRPGKNVQNGFRLAAKDGSGYFDCSDDGIMEMLMPYFRNLDFQ
jgi:V/A-type H+-transporting ATPase subunit E